MGSNCISSRSLLVFLLFIMPHFPSGNICLYLNQDFCSQFIHAIINISENLLLFCVCKTDIPSLT